MSFIYFDVFYLLLGDSSFILGRILRINSDHVGRSCIETITNTITSRCGPSLGKIGFLKSDGQMVILI